MAYLQSRATRLECGGGGGAAGGDGETGIASGAPQDANRGRFGGEQGIPSGRVTWPHAVCELSVSVLRARRRAASRTFPRTPTSTRTRGKSSIARA